MALRARMLLAMNRLFPRPIDHGGDSADDYSKWEYDSGAMMHERHFAGRVVLEDARVLDIGCGYGGKTAFYLDSGATFTVGADLLPDNATQASEFTRSHHERAEHAAFIAADAAHMPFADASFDVVTATDTFEHFAQPAEVLSEIARVLKPGGRLAFYFTPHRSPLGSHLYNHIHLPWCHLLASEPVLMEAVELDLRRAGHPDVAGHLAEIRDYYRTALNKMTVRRFLRLVRECDVYEPLYFYRKSLRGALTRPLTRIPPFDELVTTLAVGVLRRK